MQKKLLLVIVIVCLVGAFFYFGLHNLFSLEYLQERKTDWLAQYQQHPLLFLAGFFAVYVLVTSLALPAAAVLTLAAGALFGFFTGLIVVSFASTIGATIAFLITRYLLRDSVQNKFGDSLQKINDGVEREGWLYVFSMRLVPLFPFFAVNSLLALTPIKTQTFYWASQLGMLAGTAVFVNAGTQLSSITSINDIFSANIWISFLLLAAFPFIAKYVLKFIQSLNSANSHD